MVTRFAVLSIIITSLFACAPPPQPSDKPVDILNLLIIKTIGPSIEGTNELRSPRDAAVNQKGEIYIADYGNDRIVRLDSTGAFINETGGFGADDYVLSGPISIALDNISNVYVVDSGNSRIIRYDRYLNFISSERYIKGNSDIAFVRPTCIDVSNRGDIVIGDEGLAACYRLNQLFGYNYDFGGRDDIQSIIYPSSIVYDNRLFKVYVTDSHTSRVAVYDDFGLLLQTFGDEILEKPSGVVRSVHTGFWVCDEQTGMLYNFDSHGRETFRWNGYGGNTLSSPVGLYITDSDILYIVDSQTSRILITSPISGN